VRSNDFTIVHGKLEGAPKHGAFSGSYICEHGHVVLVVVNPSGRPIIEVHKTAEDRDMLASLLRDTAMQ
jgi:hypothetical protein